MAKGIQPAFLGPMSSKQFITEFSPLDASEEVLSTFKVGLFDEVVALRALCGGKREKMYGPFVRTTSPWRDVDHEISVRKWDRSLQT